MLKKIAISLGDINGVGIQLALENHKTISKLCDPIYCVNKKILKKATKKLQIKIPSNFTLSGQFLQTKINPGKVKKDSGQFSYDSFLQAIQLAKVNQVDAICTLPINKEAWSKANIHYVGHTDMLRDIFKKNAIMMLGCEKMFVALYTEHIALKKVASELKLSKLSKFLIDFVNDISIEKNTTIGVLGLNPHAGDNGVLGKEEDIIKKAIKKATKVTNQKFDLLVPDIAFTPNVRKKYKYFCAMYHDQGLAPLKALHFEESINVSLNLPIIRTSVDHGTAFDIAYKKQNKLSNKSYINAIKEAIKLAK
ncbi:4-hydroxythreonine-4-phosphate dehydrogenase [Arcobacter sp. 15-2]|uniref:4-hydroxythreonine-4-phosphate dehydrogenase n=1 Tax=Arcobacter sp. 15-2 TaxID=3374109 RepID=UPI00399C5EB3